MTGVVKRNWTFHEFSSCPFWKVRPYTFLSQQKALGDRMYTRCEDVLFYRVFAPGPQLMILDKRGDGSDSEFDSDFSICDVQTASWESEALEL